MDRDH
jgi:hypothetical protein